MAIIYTYPIVQPTVDDLIIGTDVGSSNATKSFSVQSLVSIINAAAGSGTVTSVGISNSDSFLTVTDSPIIDAGVIDIKLSAFGTPSSTTFLRGDNTWAEIGGASDITVEYDQDIITTELSYLRFQGSGVNVTPIGTGQVLVDILYQAGTIRALSPGAGIGIVNNGGDYTLTNTGVLAISAGPGISISPSSGLGGVEISATGGGGGGGVGAVLAGRGLQIDGGSNLLNPFIGTDLVGSNNYIISGVTTGSASSADSISFHDSSENEVRLTTLATIPATSLDLVKTYIDAGDANDITNTTDTGDTALSVPIVENVITLTAAQYAALGTKDANTLYLTVGAASANFNIDLTAITVSLTPIAPATGSEFTLGGDQIYPGSGGRKTLPSGSSYKFNTTISPNSGFYFCDASGNAQSPTIINAEGTATANANVTTTITGFIKNQPTNLVTITPVLNYDAVVGKEFGDWTGVGPTPSFVQAANTVSLASNEFLYAQPTAASNYDVNIVYSGSGVDAAAGPFTASQNVIITATGSITLSTGPLVLKVTNNITGTAPANVINFASTAIAPNLDTVTITGPVGNVTTLTWPNQPDSLGNFAIALAARITDTNQYTWVPEAENTTPFSGGPSFVITSAGAQGTKSWGTDYTFNRTMPQGSNIDITVTGVVDEVLSNIQVSTNDDAVTGGHYSVSYESSTSGAPFLLQPNAGFTVTDTPGTTIRFQASIILESGYRWNGTPPTSVFSPIGTGTSSVPNLTFPAASAGTTQLINTLTAGTTELIPTRVTVSSTPFLYDAESSACSAAINNPATGIFYMEPGPGKDPTSSVPTAGDYIYLNKTGTGVVPTWSSITTFALYFINSGGQAGYYGYQINEFGLVTSSASTRCNT